ncbi:ROK family protein [Pseudohalocynthiibacter aestuariivivens]|uniref:ROK family protein n=1 Tax=Pseudohalocynthiibacter aestuariivivens TaxID=1591409 RepID=A0ABV5JGH3_9RHOB|nr:ROK family protein [Pseudohalocynthiibacter aestuariivivens]MBS9716101.1 ROK family protein [Pseudohalocynthiibacter aestuariivivens]
MAKHSVTNRHLVADIGGTNTRIAQAEGSVLISGTMERFRNNEYSCFDNVLREYLATHTGVRFESLCFALAGPVWNGCGTLTNLNWKIDTRRICEDFGIREAFLLNDLEVQGHAIDHLEHEAISTIFPSQRGNAAINRNSAKLVVGLGTGFNTATVQETKSGPLILSSESGHMGLNLTTPTARALIQHLEKDINFVACEDVLSGRGIERVFQWLSNGVRTAPILSAPEIVLAADNGDEKAKETIRSVCKILGATVGDLALTHLPFGGIFLVGSVARALSPYLAEMGFDECFRAKGRFSDFMDEFSVSVMDDDFAGLKGCAVFLGQSQGRA